MSGTAVLVQYSSNYGGSTLSGHLVAQGLADAGWDVHIAFGFNGPYVDVMRELGFKTYVIPHKSWLRTSNPVRFVPHLWMERSAAEAIRALYKAIVPDLVYVNTLVSLAPVLAARDLSIPTIWHIRELFSDVGGEMRCPGVLGRAFVRSVISKLANQIIVPSRVVGENVLGRARAKDAMIVPNAVSEAFFRARESVTNDRQTLGLPEGVPVIGVPGTLRPVKGHSFLLRAVPKILAEEPACYVAITGDGDEVYKRELKALTRKLGIEDHVCFLGTVNHMEEFFRACDVICVPSASESFGRTVIEAFACGTPVIATAVGGMREIVRNGENGILVEYGNAIQLAMEMTKLLRDAALRNRLVRQGRLDAEQRFHEQQYRKQIGRIADRFALRHRSL